MFKRVGLGTVVTLMLALLASAAYADTLHDPTRPDYVAGAATSSSTGWQLSSTLISPQRRLAVINGTTVAVGDRIGGARVLAIQPGSVRLRTADGTVTVELLSTSIKTAHRALKKRH